MNCMRAKESMADFSRLEELFYNDVSGNSDLSLKGLIRNTFILYDSEFLKGIMTQGLKLGMYEVSDSGLFLFVSGTTGRPELRSIKLKGSCALPFDLLNNLRGNLMAYYPMPTYQDLEMELSKLAHHIDLEKEPERIASLKLNVSRRPRNSSRISGASLEKCIPGFFKNSFSSAKLEEINLDEDSLFILACATKIHIENSFYYCDDPSEELLHESCTITKNHGSGFIWSYELKGATNQALQTKILKFVEPLYEFIRPDFDDSVYDNFRFRGDFDG